MGERLDIEAHGMMVSGAGEQAASWYRMYRKCVVYMTDAGSKWRKGVSSETFPNMFDG
jgi:hypothetical protein